MKADKLLCYEHTGEETNKDHVHLLMIRVSCDPERLKQIAKGILECGSGNEFWTFKKKTKAHGEVTEEKSSRYITYMSKGIHKPKYNKGYEEDHLENLRLQWQDNLEEPTRDAKLCSAFEERVYQYSLNPVNAREFAEGTTIFRHDMGDCVAKLARSWAFANNDRIWNVRTATDAKMVFLTYCMRYNIDIPKDIKYW